jgi:hypothetical protein
MSIGNDFEVMLNLPLDLDEEAERAERGDEAVIGDERLHLLLGENRIALAKGKTTVIQPIEGAEPDLAYYDVPLLCVVHSHPECRFRWSRLTINLTPTKGAKIRDMSPQEVRGDKPVELKTSVGVGIKFETTAKALSAEVKPEYTSSRTVYYPEIVSSGTKLSVGYWDFLALTSDYLHANRELRLLISAPSGELVKARFNLRAKVRCAGVTGLIPLIGRHSVEIDEVYRLD